MAAPNAIEFGRMGGYTTLASMMGAHPEVAFFRRFGSLNAQNILYLQAELTTLELKLKELVKADASSGHLDRSCYDRDWRVLSESAQATDGNPEQLRTVLSIREKLKEYNEALLIQSLILKTDSPNSRDLQFLQVWMKKPSMGCVYLMGPDRDIWRNPDHGDLVVLKRRGNDSFLSRILSDFLIHWYHQFLGWRFRKPDSEEIHGNTVHYSQQTLLRISTLIGTVCASLLPVLAIVILYYVSSMERRLVIIGIFTVIFSTALGVLTNGRAMEIFSATAAFAAVQVVFVGASPFNNGTAVAT